MMKYLAIACFAVAALAASMPAEARGGCGIGWHRGPLGHCVRNGEAVVIAPHVGVVVVAPRGRVCPVGWHLGPLGHCRRN
jgi:hypothetical protein